MTRRSLALKVVPNIQSIITCGSIQKNWTSHFQ